MSRFLNRHPQLSSKFSTQVKKQRILVGNSNAIQASFRKLATVLKYRQIKPSNLYNMDEKGFLMGIASHVKVICIKEYRSPPLMQGIFS